MRLIGKSRFLTIVLTGILLISILAGCAKKETENKNNSGAQETTVQEESVTIRVGSLKGPTSPADKGRPGYCPDSGKSCGNHLSEDGWGT